jgi:hypothetical protein
MQEVKISFCFVQTAKFGVSGDTPYYISSQIHCQITPSCMKKIFVRVENKNVVVFRWFITDCARCVRTLSQLNRGNCVNFITRNYCILHIFEDMLVQIEWF